MTLALGAGTRDTFLPTGRDDRPMTPGRVALDSARQAAAPGGPDGRHSVEQGQANGRRGERTDAFEAATPAARPAAVEHTIGVRGHGA